MSELKPRHPGEYLKLFCLPASKMNITELAEHLGVTRPTLSNLINEKSSVSIEMAQRLGQAFGHGPLFWLNLQMAYDLWIAQQKNNINVSRIVRK